ncbi:MAG: STAS domain-containing protein [Oscillospiraceae bacterium]|nr:STAS domain-containing protein [Oscillospiraceae bacterium]MBR6377030.1 STAS domain-containing protein [Oscillospiraceae bacterium]
MSLNLNLINRGAQGELLLSGRLDSTTAVEAEQVFDSLTERFTDLILNMEELEYISSAGLRILKRCYMAMRRKGGTLKLKNVNKMVMEVFEVTGFAGLLQFI